MVAIRVLPPEVVNRIAAGEVIERPASVVKELLENSIDAGATEIAIQVDDGGRKRIRVRDNGCGISTEDLPLAFESHATSKFPVGEAAGRWGGRDLFQVETLGFRGEALASIAAVADLEVVSRTPGGDCAHRYRPGESGRDRGPEPVAAPVGTTVDVRNLFFNLPARRKFLRAAATEFSHILEQVLRIGLARPEISLRLEHGSRTALTLAGSGDVRERLEGILGSEKARELIEMAAGEDAPTAGEPGLRIRGYVAPPHLHRADARGQNFFVNGRWVRDRVLSHALRDAYRGCQIPGRQPLAYLFLEVPRDQVDINVHPQKTEVRFLDSRSIHNALYRGVREALDVDGGSAVRAASDDPPAESGAPGSEVVQQIRRVEQATRDFLSSPPREERPSRSGGAGGAAAGRMKTGARRRESVTAGDFFPGPSGGEPGAVPAVAAGGRPPAVQILREFIVTESAGGLVLVDQHALHEKVLYERILRQLRENSFPAQRLLLPEVIDLPPELTPFIAEVIRQLEPFGFEIEPFGRAQVAVQALPVLLERGPVAEVILDVAEWIRDHPAGEEASGEGVISGALRKIAALLACKQAVKAGMKLEGEEIRSLLEESENATDPRFCPHGRPTSIVITREELERRFDRK